MKLRLLIFGLIIFLITLMSAPNAASQQLVTIDSVDAARGEQVAVAVTLSNNTNDISGLVIPVRYPESIFKIDSVSFANSIIESGFLGGVDTTGANNLVRISYLINEFTDPLPSIVAPNGIVATIYFRVANDAPPGFIPLDSAYEVQQFGNIQVETYVIQMSDPSGTLTYYPDCKAGGINVRIATGIDDNNLIIPDAFNLAQNYPNPFNPTTTIGFSLPTSGKVTLEVFNVLGQRVNTLVDEYLSAGNHEIEFNASDQPSGVFFYRLSHSEGTITKKMILVK